MPYNLPFENDEIIEKQPTVGSQPQMMISGMMSNMLKKSDKRQDDGNGVNVRMMGKRQDYGNGGNVWMMGKRQDDGKGGSNLMMRVGRAQNRDEPDTRGFYYLRKPVGRMAYPYVTQGFYYDA